MPSLKFTFLYMLNSSIVHVRINSLDHVNIPDFDRAATSTNITVTPHFLSHTRRKLTTLTFFH